MPVCLNWVDTVFLILLFAISRLVEKVKEYDLSKRDVYHATIWKNGAESAEKCANIRDKILQNAKKKPGYEEKLAYRKQKRRENKEAKRQVRKLAADTVDG